MPAANMAVKVSTDSAAMVAQTRTHGSSSDNAGAEIVAVVRVASYKARSKCACCRPTMVSRTIIEIKPMIPVKRTLVPAS